MDALCVVQVAYHTLHPQYSRDVWIARQRAVITKGSRYIKPRFDIIFATFMLLYVASLPR